MTRKTVLLELLDENTWYIHDVLKEPAEGLHWTPDGEGNSIAVTIWHSTRGCDVFLTQHVFGKSAAEEVWFASGWDKKAGYDPRGVGTNGWGMVHGYTAEEVKAIPQMSPEVLKGYFDEVTAAVRDYLESTSDEVLDEMAPGFEGKQHNYFWVRHPIFDMTRHVGEVLALKEMWGRMHK